MLSYHTSPMIQRRYERLLKRCPTWLQLDYSLIGNLVDLQFQLENEIDLVEDNGGSIQTKAQLHRIKMLLAEVMIARQDELALRS
jgi:hypothetical protein